MMSQQRLYGLDFSRAVLMALGIFYHTALIYTPGVNWAVKSVETSQYFLNVASFLSAFRMESFYLISGLFYYLIFIKKRDSFIQERVTRTLVPLVFIGLLLNAGTHFLLFPERYTFNLDYFIEGRWLNHLWFIGNLTVYFLVSVPICKFIETTDTLSPRALLNCMILTALCAVCGAILSNNTYSGTFVFLNFSNLYYYFPYFILGAVAYRNIDIFMKMLSRKYCIAFFLMFLGLSSILYFNSYFPKSILIITKHVIALPLMMMSFTLLNWIGNRKSTIALKFSNASYTIYLVHQPLIIGLYLLIMNDIHLGIAQEYFIVVVLTSILSFAIHELVVSRVPLLKFLFNGASKPKLKEPQVIKQVTVKE